MFGFTLVSHVRSAMANKLRGLPLPEEHPELSGVRAGVFVSLEALVRSGSFERRELRGSLGVLTPYRDLAYDSAKIAAKLVSSIPRFNELDLRRSVVEVTLVENFARWDGSLGGFVWGREGVYAEAGGRGLVVLPQTMVERRVFGSALLRYIDSVVGPPERLFKFSTKIFYEVRPMGEVVERELWKNRLLKNIH